MAADRQVLLRAEWLQSDAVKSVMAALEAVRPGGARFVGGCVRNTLMGRPVDDIDIATQLRPDETLNALQAADIKAIPTGIEHGTVTAIIDSQPFEITSLRRDVETDGRRAVVAFTEDWGEDSQRRDFRINALYAEPNGVVHDPTGGGLADAEAGRIVFIGDADDRLREDYLRILRFFRFNAWYGAEIDAPGLEACARQTSGLRHIARERIWKELHKLLAAPDPYAALEAMRASGVLSAVLPHSADLGGMHDLRLCEHLLGAKPDPLLRLMALIPRRADAVHETAETLRLSKAQTARLVMWAADNLPSLEGVTGRELRAILYWHGKQAVADRAMLSGRDVRDVIAAIHSWRRPDFPVTGDDALAAGLKGADIGKALSRVAALWVDSDFQLERANLLKHL